MSLKSLSTVVVTMVLAAGTFTTQANNDAGHNWVPNQPTNNYWQTPNWSGFSMPPAYNRAPPAYNNRAYNNNRRPVAPPPANYPPPDLNRSAPPPPTGPYSGSMPAPRPTPYRGAPMPRGPYVQGPYNQGPYNRGPYNQGRYNGPSAFNTPGYNPHRRYGGNNGWNNNRFWGRSGPNTWMNPSKQNWENSWDDMINSPSRMGEMPGGWTAPEVTMPNPIDMGDQFQDNIKDLPEQMRDGNIGNNVSN